jgi:hypothetical protein
MAKTKSNEWNFTSNVATEMSRLLALPDFAGSDLGRAEAERTLTGEAKRPDLVFFDRNDTEKAIVTGELKAPWTKEGKTPFDTDLVEGAHAKAVKVGARFFITWNIRRAVIWKTDDDGVALLDRAVYDKELLGGPLKSGEDLTTTSFKQTFEKAMLTLLADLAAIVAGKLGISYLPLDRLFVARLEAMLDHVNENLVWALLAEMGKKKAFTTKLEQWMRAQSWIVSDQTREENAERAVRFSSYVLVNRMCFYNALRRTYPKMPQLRVSNANRTGDQLRKRLTELFDVARSATGNYQTVFDQTDADLIPFLADECVPEWRKIIESLDKYDFAHIDREVIGTMYEQLIRPEERHRFGQHYTQPAVVDLINSFSIQASDDTILDPACGGGTFLVRAYSRKRFLDGTYTHSELLRGLYGCDILSYACHLSVINLAVRDLVNEDNFPQIHLGDYMEVEPGKPFCVHPIGMAAGGLQIREKVITLPARSVDAIVGNPPYINAKLIPGDKKRRYLEMFREEFPQFGWEPGSDILIWFWVHSLKFLRPGGRLALITQAAWIDVEYGFPLQNWIFNNFRIVAVMESEREPWFTDARVATVVIVLEQESDSQKRDNSTIRFLQFRRPLRDLMPGLTDAELHVASDGLRDRILMQMTPVSNSDYRIRIVRQDDLRREGEDDEGVYVGGKWGRHLRALDCVYDLQRKNEEDFCELTALAEIDRGSTTNCDDFFIVRDVSAVELGRLSAATAFKNTYGVERRDVEQGRLRIVQRDDNRRFALASGNLRPIIKTARDVFERVTSQMESDQFAVIITNDRSQLTKLEAKYVKGGEDEDWHTRPSFSGRDDWYKLRDIDPAEIYFVKTIQYAPQLLWNNSGILPNQRLYRVRPRQGVDAELLAAALSSTWFAAERFAGAKALGREAANDIEVFTARKMLVVDVRKFSSAEATSLRSAFRRLRLRPVGPILEGALVDAGLASAQAYVDTTPLSPNVFPAELLDPDRREIDRVIAKCLGIATARLDTFLCELYLELTGYQRKSRLLELQAQVNRRGAVSSSAVTPLTLGDEILGELIEEGFGLRNVPDDFYPDNGKRETIKIPVAGRAVAAEDGLFSSGKYKIAFGRLEGLGFEWASKRDLVLLLAQHGVRGDVKVPTTEAGCAQTLTDLRAYLDDLRQRVEQKSTRVSDDEVFRVKVVEAAVRAAIKRHMDQLA